MHNEYYYEYNRDNLMASCGSSGGLSHQAVPQAKSTGGPTLRAR